MSKLELFRSRETLLITTAPPPKTKAYLLVLSDSECALSLSPASLDTHAPLTLPIPFQAPQVLRVPFVYGGPEQRGVVADR